VKKKLTFTSDSCHLAEIRKEVREFLAACAFEETKAELLILGLDEACTNIIRYAYDHECRPIRLKMERLSDRVRFVLRDYGRSCDPKQIRSRSLKKIRPGGVGVHIIRHAFDLVNYQPCPRGTRLILEKKFENGPNRVRGGRDGRISA
jgi:anti-sigma regulatory factor (Ser/Thr protein kinase)